MDDNYKKLDREAESLRKLAFFGVAVSTIATLTAIIAVPTAPTVSGTNTSKLNATLDV
jgi:hypothetical protein